MPENQITVLILLPDSNQNNSIHSGKRPDRSIVLDTLPSIDLSAQDPSFRSSAEDFTNPHLALGLFDPIQGSRFAYFYNAFQDYRDPDTSLFFYVITDIRQLRLQISMISPENGVSVSNVPYSFTSLDKLPLTPLIIHMTPERHIRSWTEGVYMTREAILSANSVLR